MVSPLRSFDFRVLFFFAWRVFLALQAVCEDAIFVEPPPWLSSLLKRLLARRPSQFIVHIGSISSFLLLLLLLTHHMPAAHVLIATFAAASSTATPLHARSRLHAHNRVRCH